MGFFASLETTIVIIKKEIKAYPKRIYKERIVDTLRVGVVTLVTDPFAKKNNLGGRK